MSEATERAVVKTYVPRYQKDEWRTHATELGMSQSEFVRAMVQAGRRGFDGVDPHSGGATSRGSGVELQVLDVLSDGGYAPWDDLVSRLSSRLEDRLEEALQTLQAAGQVHYSGQRGGYTLVEDADE